jgi:hypothetical protein
MAAVKERRDKSASLRVLRDGINFVIPSLSRNRFIIIKLYEMGQVVMKGFFDSALLRSE